MSLNKRIIVIFIAVILILSVPLIAMQFSANVNWSLSDFFIAGVLLSGTGLLLELVLRKVNKKENRIILFVIIIALLLLIWIEFAVGIFGTPIAGS
ncbi:hypothetical protein [uncultured Winogradskyella sp.]|uniref:hypothetical protein n=1 Tax=uncultured Winogradskyella sp. TaxID=395353 RepID=UPI0030DAC957|tara:strand:+ start:28501 stop:28788 length:288 start_codon:yes stop_codon:yes gene_type:complete